jgi:antirestriction protein ArdC
VTDIYQNVTARIVAALETGAAPWVRPWKGSGDDGFDVNHRSGKPYSGINVLALWSERMLRGYESTHWLTYKQALEAGGNVRKGSKGSQIVFWKFLENDVDERIPLARAYTVFNLEQCDGIERPERGVEAPLDERLRAARAFCSATGAKLSHGGDVACYMPTADAIRMPPMRAFEGPEFYYAVLLHELTHWTMPEARCNRVIPKRFGDDTYAMEELVAELGAAFGCAELGVPGVLRHEGYLAHWLRVLKADERAIFIAASAARKAHEYLKSLQPVAAAEKAA